MEKGLTGQELAEAIQKERARLGINDDPPENKTDRNDQGKRPSIPAPPGKLP
jgi:hypothetical protein